MQQEKKIDSSTAIPIGWLVALVGACGTVFMVAFGIVVWATRLEARADSHSEKITKLETQAEQYRLDMQAVRESLLRLEFKAGTLPKGD